MLTQYADFPAFEIQYDVNGELVDVAMQDDAVAYFGNDGAGVGVSDLFVISHGWNNDIAEARQLYLDFFGALRSVLSSVELAGRTFGIAAIFWPSKRFADPALIPGGAAALADPTAGLATQLDHLADVFAADPTSSTKIAHAKSLLPLLESGESAQDDYVRTLASLTPPPRYQADEGLDDARKALDATKGSEILQRLSIPFSPAAPPVPGSGGAAGLETAPQTEWGAAAGFNPLGGILSAAANLGDLLTYYTMKDRAAVVGSTGAAATVEALLACRAGADSAPAPRVHLIGHSFGGRLVTALANALAPTSSVASMNLLEAAYSQNGLAHLWNGVADGSFREVVIANKIRGAILITHSVHDTAVGIAYPLASRLANQTASSLIGGPDDAFGGMGRNGAQHTPEVGDPNDDFDLLAVGATYPVLPSDKRIRNLDGDGPPPKPTIASHGDIAKPEIAYAILAHIAMFA